VTGFNEHFLGGFMPERNTISSSYLQIPTETAIVEKTLAIDLMRKLMSALMSGFKVRSAGRTI
jgi:hypothetical protein